MKLFVTALALLAAMASAIPTPANNWKAQCTQTMAGNIAGLRPGTQQFQKFYNFPSMDRYSYPNGNQQVYRFDVVDQQGYGTAFGWNTNTPSKCPSSFCCRAVV